MNASTVWHPYYIIQIGKIEAIQRRAARFAKRDYVNHSSVLGIIKDLKWPILEEEYCCIDILPYITAPMQPQG